MVISTLTGGKGRERITEAIEKSLSAEHTERAMCVTVYCRDERVERVHSAFLSFFLSFFIRNFCIHTLGIIKIINRPSSQIRMIKPSSYCTET
jgi:flagellar biosynthesis/type III secretory pathway ATPase